MTDFDDTYDDIRSYRDDEIPAAMQRIVASGLFPAMALYVYPNLSQKEAEEMFLTFRNIKDYQTQFTAKAIERFISMSIDDFSVSGIEKLQPDRNYLFISNHRDIVLDACLLSYHLHQNSFDTPEITFGANLMINPLIIDIGKSNKMFKVERPGANMREFYKQSEHLSAYIRNDLTVRHQSVWIAQRNGRTKDGNDHTDQGIITMFGMSGTGDKVASACELNIVPISISYEWESCDILKVLELYTSRSQKYVKKPGEDLNSILTGIRQYKGRVHISICDPLTQECLMPYNELTRNEFNKKVASIIDSRILGAYRLYPNNYIAHDLRYGQDRFSNEYTAEQKNAFTSHLSSLKQYDAYPLDILEDIFLGLYSNPIDNIEAQKKGN